MDENIRQCAMRLKEMREIQELSQEYMAKKTGIPLDEYILLERGEKDFSFSFLLAAAQTLGIDISDLVTGEQSKLSFCAVTRQGDGLPISRRKAYSYKHLAYNFKNRKAEPFIVTVTSEAPYGSLETSTHESQEFLYILEGSVELKLNGANVILNAGDSAYFDSTKPHAFYTHNCETARFITLVIK